MKSKSLFFLLLLTFTSYGYAEQNTASSISQPKEQAQTVSQVLNSVPQVHENENLQAETQKEFTLSDANKYQVAAAIACVAVVLGYVATRATY